MTIPVEVDQGRGYFIDNNDEENNQGPSIEETIDFILSQPVETLNMMQQSFLTQPSISSAAYHDICIKDYSTVKDKESKVIFNDFDENEEIQEIQLEDEDIKSSIMMLNESNEPVSLPKVDNFMDDFEANDVEHLVCLDDKQTLEKERESTQHIKSILSSKDTIATLTQAQPVITTGNGNYEVKLINSVTECTALPGQYNKDSCDEIQEVENVENGKMQKCVDSCEDLEDGKIERIDGSNDCDENDAVVAFRLDESYDYDNVKFTPRY